MDFLYHKIDLAHSPFILLQRKFEKGYVGVFLSGIGQLVSWWVKIQTNQ